MKAFFAYYPPTNNKGRNKMDHLQVARRKKLHFGVVCFLAVLWYCVALATIIVTRTYDGHSDEAIARGAETWPAWAYVATGVIFTAALLLAAKCVFKGLDLRQDLLELGDQKSQARPSQPVPQEKERDVE